MLPEYKSDYGCHIDDTFKKKKKKRKLERLKMSTASVFTAGNTNKTAAS